MTLFSSVYKRDEYNFSLFLEESQLTDFTSIQTPERYANKIEYILINCRGPVQILETKANSILVFFKVYY